MRRCGRPSRCRSARKSSGRTSRRIDWPGVHEKAPPRRKRSAHAHKEDTERFGSVPSVFLSVLRGRAFVSSEADLVSRTMTDAIAAHENARRGAVQPAADAAAAIVGALRAGGKVLLFGNGGSAADAQHAAAELVGRFERQRQALAAIALTTDTSVITAIGNDEGYSRVFARQIEALGRRGDVALAITTSGRSRNIVDALAAAK